MICCGGERGGRGGAHARAEVMAVGELRGRRGVAQRGEAGACGRSRNCRTAGTHSGSNPGAPGGPRPTRPPARTRCPTTTAATAAALTLLQPHRSASAARAEGRGDRMGRNVQENRSAQSQGANPLQSPLDAEVLPALRPRAHRGRCGVRRRQHRVPSRPPPPVYTLPGGRRRVGCADGAAGGWLRLVDGTAQALCPLPVPSSPCTVRSECGWGPCDCAGAPPAQRRRPRGGDVPGTPPHTRHSAGCGVRRPPSLPAAAHSRRHCC